MYRYIFQKRKSWRVPSWNFELYLNCTFCVASLISPIFLFRLYSVDQMNLEHDDGLSAQVSPEFVFSLQPAFLIYYRHVYREVLKYQR